MRRIAERDGPESVAFGLSSPSTSAIADSDGFIRRLMNAFGTPNSCSHIEVCGWGRGFATRYTFGIGSVALGGGNGAMADIANSGCLILWGYNPSASRLTHATAAVSGLKRGMRLIVIDPRHVGLANEADVWMRVRPGSDGALALGLANLMILRGWYDRDFIRRWSNGPLLVRDDTGRLLTEGDLTSNGDRRRYFAWDSGAARLVPYDPAAGRYDGDATSIALEGERRVATPNGDVVCRPAFQLYAEMCRQRTQNAFEQLANQNNPFAAAQRGRQFVRRHELLPAMSSGREPAQHVFGADDRQRKAPEGAVESGEGDQAAGPHERGGGGDESGDVVDMLDDFHREHDVEFRALAGQILDRSYAIGQIGAGRRRVGARDFDRARRRVDSADDGAQPRQRLGEQPGAAADVEDVEVFQRAVSGAPEMRGDRIAKPGDADGIDPVQRRHRPRRVPPIVAQRVETGDFLAYDARGGHP